MNFTCSHSSSIDSTVPRLDGTYLETVTPYNPLYYLGIPLDDMLTLSVHIDRLLKKQNSMVFIFIKKKKGSFLLLDKD